MSVLSEAKKILDAHGGILGEDVLVAKLINRNLFKFTKDELKLILISDFDVTYLKRNKLLYKAFYIEPLFEDLLTKMALYVNDYFEKRKKSAVRVPRSNKKVERKRAYRGARTCAPSEESVSKVKWN